MRDAPPLVAKLGGSLHASPLRGAWIDALSRYPGKVTLVCGGGPFADAVRATQPAMRYSDETAHAMAVLAMEQYALALASLHGGLALAATPREIAKAHAGRRVALWRPATMVGAAHDVHPAWDVTSDSLAAWLAKKLGAKALLMIKSVDIGADLDLTDIVTAGIVDPAFPAYVDDLPVFVAGPRALIDAPRLLSRGDLPGAQIGGFVGAELKETA